MPARQGYVRLGAVTVLLTLAMVPGSGASAAQAGPPAAAAPAASAIPFQQAAGPVLPAPPAAPFEGSERAPRETVVAPDTATVQEPRPWYAVLGISLLVLVSLALTVVAGTTLVWALHAWRSPAHLEATRFQPVTSPPRRRFSLLVPGRHEEAVMGDTLDRLAAMDYDDLEILAIVGHDDDGTAAVAHAAAARHPSRVRVVVDYSWPKNKPKAMNTALAEVTGDVVGVFDAEDEVHPALIRNIDAKFTEADADIVQGGVQLMNVGSSWWALRNCLEYYFWFRSRLHFHASRRFIPLGGNTVFVRTELLRQAGGWDAECLAEDCEIGVRLSSAGARVAVAYDPEIVTREETPGTITSLVKQRTRWDQGFLQVLRKGVWRQLPGRRQRLLARYTLSMPFLQAFTGLLIPVSLFLMFAVQVPAWVVLVTLLPLVPTVITVVVEMCAFHEFCRTYGVKDRVRDYVGLVLGTFPYQMLLAFAAIRSVVREARGDGSWEKTEHTGAHRASSAVPDAAGVPARVIDLTTIAATLAGGGSVKVDGAKELEVAR